MTLRAQQDELDKNALKWLVPISALTPARFEQLVAQTEIEQLNAGATLFKEGDTDPRAVYLLSGKVVLTQGKSVVDTVSGGSEQSRYPLAHHNPRQLTAVAKSRLVFVRIDTALLDALLGQGGNASAYEVSDVEEDLDASDWMSQLLQSDTLKHLPVESIQSMLLRLEEIAVKKGDVVIRQGELGDYYYILRKGSASVSVQLPDQPGSKVVAQLQPGDPFGEEALIIDNTRNATVKMESDGIVMRLSKTDFDELMMTPLINWVSRDEANKMVAGGAQWLDVRMPAEVAMGAMDGSINRPLSELRASIGEFDSNKSYICYCDSGRRSSVAAFLLSQRGLSAYVLRGGFVARKPAPADTQMPAINMNIVSSQAENVISFNAEQESARQRAIEDEVVVRLRQEREKRAAIEAELAQLRAEQAMTAELAQNELNLRAEAEAEKARAIEEAQRMQRQVEQEAQRRQQAEAEAQEARDKAQQTMERAVEDARRFKLEREEAQRQTEAKLAELQEEREAVRMAAEAEAKRLHDEAAAVRRQVAEEAEQLRIEREEARARARQAAEKLQQEQAELQRQADAAAAKMLQELEQAREAARTEAERLRQEAEAAQRHAEAEARRRTEQLATEVAEAEQKRQRAEQQAQQLLDQAESARLQAEAETAALEARQAELRLQAEEELARLQIESNTARQRAEHEARKQQQAEQARIEAQQQAEQAQKEAELVRKQAEQEAAALQAEAEKIRLEAEEQATRALSAAEQSCLRAKEEAARLEAQAETARTSLENLDTQQLQAVQRLEDEARAARAAAELAVQNKAAAEQARQQAEGEARRLRQEAQAARQQAEKEAATLISAAEKTRQQAEKEASTIRQNAESARQLAESKAAEVSREAEEKRRQMDAQAERMRQQAEQARGRAAQVSQKLRDEAQQLSSRPRQLDEPAATDVITELSDAIEINDTVLPRAVTKPVADVDALPVIPEEPDSALLEGLQDIDQGMAEIDKLLDNETLMDDLQGFRPNRSAAQKSARQMDLQQEQDMKPLNIPEMDLDEDETGEEPVPSARKPPTTASQPDLDVDEMELLAAAVEIELAETVKDLTEASEQIELGRAFAPVEPTRRSPATLAPVDEIEVDVELDEISQLIDEASDKYDDSVLHETVFTDQLPERRRNPKPLIIAAASVAAFVVVGIIGWAVLSTSDTPPAGQLPQPTQQAQAPQPAAVTRQPEVTPEPEPVTPAEVVSPAAPVAPVEPQSVAEKPPEPVFVTPTPYRDELRNGSLGPSLVNLPAGEFTMGSPETSLNFAERPPRTVSLPAFAISQYEITVAQYQRFLRATNRPNLSAAELGGAERQPVARVSWLDARDYARWLSGQTGQTYRLPSEAEWEYAADAGANTHFWWGPDMQKGRATCFNCGTQWDATSTAPVGSFEPNRYLLYDMAGNVAEWVADCRHGNYKGAPVDGSAWLTGDCDTRMVRGGAFNSPSDTLRTRNRTQYPIDSRLNNIGFRLVRELN